MNAGVEVELGVIVTITAVNSPQYILVGEVLDVGVLVTIDTLQLAVNGIEKRRIVNVQRNCPAVTLGLELRVVMAVETRVVVDSGQG